MAAAVLESLLLLMLISLASSKGIFQASSKSVATSCQSIECVSLASEIASRMNTSADPCQDFYNYACGNFPNVVKYDPLKESLFEDTIGLMSEKLEKNIYEMLVLDRVVTSKDADMSGLYNFTRSFYRSCRQWMFYYDMNPPGATNLPKSLLQDVFRHLNQTVRATSGGFASIESTLAGLIKAGGESMFSFGLPYSFVENVISKDDVNLTNTARAEIDINTRMYERSEINLDKIVKSFADANIGYPMLNFSAQQSRGQNDTFQFSDLRSAIFAPLSANCTLNYSKSVYTVAELDNLTKCVYPKNPFSWFKFLDDLLQSPVDPMAMLIVTNPLRVINFVTFFKSRQVLQNSTTTTLSQDITFLVFDWLLSFSTFFPKSLKEPWLNFKPKVIFAPESDSVSFCMFGTKSLLQPIVEHMYRKAYHREDFNDIKQLIQLIKNASIASVRRQTWITLSSKAAIVRKIQSMQQSIGLDDLTPGQLKSFYNSTLVNFRNLNLGGDLKLVFGKLLSLAACAYARKNFDIVSGGSPVSLFMDINPLVVNAFNWVAKNQIIFPMAILAPPVYHPTYPDYINIGSLGYVIGHEIGHSFDNMGHTINQLGASGHFWDNKTEENYLARMECVRNRYGKYFLYPGGPTHQSNTTLGNDIADIIGIKAAVETLKMLKSRRKERPMPRLPNLPGDFSPEQMLFIQAAHNWCFKSEPSVIEKLFGDEPTHSPHHLRIRGIAENTQEFAEAFKCRAGKPMNPRDKCSFW